MPTLSKHGKPVGRPPVYSDEIAQRICDEMVLGRSLKSICDQEDWAPALSTVMKWLGDASLPFAENYRRAQDLRTETLMERAFELVSARPTVQIPTKNGIIEQIDAAAVQANRVEAELIERACGRMAPKRWSDKQRVEHSSDEEHPVQVVIHHVGSKPPES